MQIIEIDPGSNPWRSRLDDMVRLQKAAYQIESQLIRYPNLPPLFETAQDLIDSGERFLLCCNAGNSGDLHPALDLEITGVMSFEPTPTGFHIDRLVVAPAHFGRGIASQLLAAVESIALQEGQRHLSVSTALHNQPAVRLYQKAGFIETSRPTLPDGLQLIRFEKWLSRTRL